jgi:hypothetical protein
MIVGISHGKQKGSVSGNSEFKGESETLFIKFIEGPKKNE